MCALMCGKLILFLKCHLAFVTFVCVVPHVALDVILLLYLGLESFGTMITIVWLVRAMYSFDMLIQTSFFPKFFLAVPANLRHNIAM